MIRRLATGVAVSAALLAYHAGVDYRDLQTPAVADEGTQLAPPEVVVPLVQWAYIDAMNAADQRGHEVWDAVADCESGEWDRHHHPIAGSANWASTAGSYEGGLQFSHSTWVAAGGRAYAEHAYEATRTEQIDIADHWLARTSWKQWPACSRKLGLR